MNRLTGAMIKIADLRNVARERLKDARALLKAGRYDGAIYMGGYVAEMALKCRICRTLKWLEFPETGGEFRNYLSLKTHDLSILRAFSGAEEAIKLKYALEWNSVSTWTPELRYSSKSGTNKSDAECFVNSAATLLRFL